MTNPNLISRYIDDILLKVISLGDCYGYSISKTIAKMTDGHWQIKEATLYSGLRRLEADKQISAYWGDETQGGRRKYYSLTEAGRGSLAESTNNWEATKLIMDKIFGWRNDTNE
ncbi:MAG: PadR family transcriptional regulator [Defluviitaleaceae bacterium]|nr:PadR family transcriptional regulator [Defluviitaleaceae bacterium]